MLRPRPYWHPLRPRVGSPDSKLPCGRGFRATATSELPIGMSMRRSATASARRRAVSTAFARKDGTTMSVPASSGVARPNKRWLVRTASMRGNREKFV